MFYSYLHSDFHKFGCLFAIVGCLCTLFGIFHLHWFTMLFISYTLGLIFFIAINFYTAYQQTEAPTPSRISPHYDAAIIESEQIPPPDLDKHQLLLFDFEQLQKRSFAQLNFASKQHMTEIHQVMQFMTQKMKSSQDYSFAYEIENIQRTMNAYLSPALQHFCNLPSFLRERKVIEQQYTPQQLLEQQLEMILNELKNISEDIYLNDLNALADHNKYLEYKLKQHQFFKIDI